MKSTSRQVLLNVHTCVYTHVYTLPTNIFITLEMSLSLPPLNPHFPEAATALISITKHDFYLPMNFIQKESFSICFTVSDFSCLT